MMYDYPVHPQGNLWCLAAPQLLLVTWQLPGPPKQAMDARQSSSRLRSTCDLFP